ncbi:MAG: PP2C family protein-serine/threonine phosphatase [Thermoanaerobaculia bacterium]
MSSTAIPVTARRTYGWRTPGEAVREMIIGALLGSLVLVIEKGGGDRVPAPHDFARNSILGASIVMGSRGLEMALGWAIEQSRVPTLFRTIVYVVGGCVGYFTGVSICSVLIKYETRDFEVSNFHFVYALVVTAFLSALIGLMFHHNRKRNNRLLATMERLKEHEFAEKELEIAREMQERLLPPAKIQKDGYRINARTHAAHIVGGDFYDVIQLADDAIAVLAADVSGKGIAASLLMASCKAAVPFLASTGSAADVMRALNQRLYDQLERREFVAMVFARFDSVTGALDVVNAGMPDPFVLGIDSALRTMTFAGDRLPLGAMRGARYESTRLTLAPGERLLLFSDGLPEAVKDGAPIGYERAEALVRGAADVDEIVRRVTADPAVTIEDDLTLLMLERTQIADRR